MKNSIALQLLYLYLTTVLLTAELRKPYLPSYETITVKYYRNTRARARAHRHHYRLMRPFSLVHRKPLHMLLFLQTSVWLQ